MTELVDIFPRLLNLDLRISRDNTKTSARCIEQYSVELGEHLRTLAAVLAGNDDIGNTQSVTISIERLQTVLFEIVSY